MIHSASKFFVSQIFDDDNNIKYIIPKYQRDYIWGKDNWEDLVNDIEESSENHFIGSIICINKGMAHRQILEVVDGQQRLTTISLLYCAIYKLLTQDHKEELNDDDHGEIRNLKFRIVQKNKIDNKEEIETKIDLSELNFNFKDYKSLLHEIEILNFAEVSKKKGLRQIYRAYRYLLNKLMPYSKKELLILLDKINRVILVEIEVNSNSDAFILFESLNDRGIPLTAIDLIKNKVLSEFDKKNKSIDIAYNKWRTIIEDLSDYAIQERFLRHYYNAFKWDRRIKINNVNKAIRSNIISIYETLVERDLDFIFNELYEKSKLYCGIINFNNNGEEIFVELKKELEDLSNVKAAPSYLFLLFLFSLENKPPLSFYKAVIKFLVNYFVRRNLTDYPGTQNLDNIFMSLIDELVNDDKNINFDFITDYLKQKDRISSDEIFENNLRGDIYDINSDVTRFILIKLEESRETKEIFRNFWERSKNNQYIWTIEHIFPEGQNIPAEWIKMIADGDLAEAKKIQQGYVHKLGNLTLTGYNSSLSNFDFMKKRDREDVLNLPIGYKNGLFLNRDLAKLDKWTVEDIIKRTDELCEIALKVFKV